MSKETLHRYAPLDLEVIRNAATDERIIAGIVAPYNVAALVRDGGRPYQESFKQGAFSKTIQEAGRKVRLLSQHERRSNPLGVATLFREETQGLYAEFKVSKTQAGDEALELVRDGALDAFSVGFSPIRQVTEGGVVVRTEVALSEVSLVTFPSYSDAKVTETRSDVLNIEDYKARLDALRYKPAA